MKTIFGIGNIDKSLKDCVLVIGVFDGVHRGHQALIKKAVRRAKARKAKVVVMTFAPHPVHVLYPQKYLPLIVSLNYRLKLLERFGVDACVVVRFTQRFAQMSPQNFIARYLVQGIKPKDVFVGDDFRFGQNRSGTLECFREMGARYGFQVHSVIPVKKGDGVKIGSTAIRELITAGELSKARRLLGHGIIVTGKVRRGDGRGKTLGFPTANIYPQHQVIPPVGVYAVRVQLNGKKYLAMANIGYRPSFNTRREINIEVHIFSFRRNLYGKEITVEFLKKIRTEKKFPSKENLISQIKRDAQRAKTIFSKTTISARFAILP